MKSLAVEKLRVQKVVRRGDSWRSNIENTPYKGCLQKITRIVRKRIEEVIDESLGLYL